MLDLPPCALCSEPFHMGSRCTAPIPDGRRNDSLFRIAVRLIRWGGRWFDAERVEEYLLAENERRCVPPFPASNVRTIARSSTLGTIRRSLRREGDQVEA